MNSTPKNETDTDPQSTVGPISATSESATGTTLRASMVLAAIVIPAALAIGAYALLRDRPMAGHAATLPQRFQLDLDTHFDIPASLIAYQQRAEIPLSMEQPRALAVGADGRIYVAGDHTIQMFRVDGQPDGEIQLEVEPTCLAVAADDFEEPGRLYIGTAQGVIIYGPDGTAQGAWPSLDEKSVLTSIAISLHEVFVADAGHRLVLRYGLDGQLLGQIGAASADRKMPGFVIPSPYFDLVVAPDMFLHVVNPGARRIECYTFDGQLQGFWGTAGAGIADFFGCCNPAHIARLSDGRFVTSEKGVPRIKIYSELGDFESVVAGPAELDIPSSALGDARGDQPHRVYDVAVNSSGDVLVLDAHKHAVRIFSLSGDRAPDAPTAPATKDEKSAATGRA